VEKVFPLQPKTTWGISPLVPLLEYFDQLVLERALVGPGVSMTVLFRKVTMFIVSSSGNFCIVPTSGSISI
jgi:hypothetical protein